MNNVLPIVISAPFGNHFLWLGTTPTLGTFTWERRGGALYRLWRCLRTLRYQRKAGGWVNRLGLPNDGLRSLPPCHRNVLGGVIVSVHGFTGPEWDSLLEWLHENTNTLAIELNLSCPNLGRSPEVSEALGPVCRALGRGQQLIAKLPPVRWMDMARPLYAAGVRTFHCCNTIPVPGGGLSGKALKNYSLWAIRDLRDVYGDGVHLIGGGGVTHLQDALDYRAAGADSIAIGSALLNPFAWRRLRRLPLALSDHEAAERGERQEEERGQAR